MRAPARTYFPHYVKSEPSMFHRWFYDTVPGLIDQPTGQLIEISAPRGEAKSTLGTQLFTLWSVLTKRKRFIPVVMDSFDQAATMLEAVKVELDVRYVGFDVPNEFVIGYGLDYAERYRNVPFVATLAPHVYQ